MARPYLRVLDEHPEAERTPAYVESFSPRPRSFVAAPEESWLWGDATDRARARARRARRRCRSSPGWRSRYSRSSASSDRCCRAHCESASPSESSCARSSRSGVRDVDGPERYLTPYRFLFDFAPGWDGVRTPGRINTLTSLGLALLAGAGLCVVVRALRDRVRGLATAVGVARRRRDPARGARPADAPAGPRATGGGPPRGRAAAPPAPDLRLRLQLLVDRWVPGDGERLRGLRPRRLRRACAGRSPASRTSSRCRRFATSGFEPCSSTRELAAATSWEGVERQADRGARPRARARRRRHRVPRSLVPSRRCESSSSTGRSSRGTAPRTSSRRSGTTTRASSRRRRR